MKRTLFSLSLISFLSGCVPGLTPPIRIPGNETNQPATTNSPSGVQNPVFIVNINTGGTVNQEIPNSDEIQVQDTNPEPEPEGIQVHSYSFPDKEESLPNKGDLYNELSPITQEQRELGQYD